MELAVCYDLLRKRKLAQTYNEAAAKIKPGDPAVEYNRNYFEWLKASRQPS